MISGILLLDHLNKYSTVVFFKKRFIRIVIPYVLWSTIWVFYKADFCPDIGDIRVGIIDILNFKAQPIYWFFSCLFTIYLTFPLFNYIKEKEKFLKYFILLSIIFEGVIPYIADILSIEKYGFVRFISGSAYIVYPYLGFYIINYCKASDFKKIILFGIICILIKYLITAGVTLYKNFSVWTLLCDPKNFLIMSYSVAILLLIRLFCKRNRRYDSIILFLSKYSFGVYLLHMFILEYQCKILKSLNFNFDSSITYRFVGSVFVYLLSLIICYFFSRLKILKVLIP